MDPVTLNLIIQGITLAVPGVLNIIHIFTQANGDTTVVIIGRAKQDAVGDKNLVAAWNASHSAAAPKVAGQ